MGFKRWLRSFLGEPVDEELYINGSSAGARAERLSVGVFATKLAISKIARVVAKCEFQTYIRGQPEQKQEYYRWNVKPNISQNAVEFKNALVSRLLLYGEALIIEVDGQLLLSTGFSRHSDTAIFEDYFDGVQVANFTFSRRFYYSDVIYLKLDNVSATGQIEALLGEYDALTKMAVDKYRRSGGRKGIARVAATLEGNPDRKAKIDELFSSQFKRYFENENSVIVLPNGVDYDEDKVESQRRTTSEVNDITALTREVYATVARAYGVPLPLLFSDVADTSGAMEDLLTLTVEPICRLIETEINAKLYGYSDFVARTFMRISTARAVSGSIFNRAAQIDKLLSCGYASIDELRRANGDEPIGEDWSEKHYITKNYETVNNGEEVER